MRNRKNGISFLPFRGEDAWRLGEMLVDAAKGYDGGVAVGIVQNGLKVFQFVTEGATRHNTQWLDRKVNLVTQFHKSSLHVYTDFELKGITLEGERLDPMDFAMCGGGFPLTIKRRWRGGRDSRIRSSAPGGPSGHHRCSAEVVLTAES